MQRLRPRLGTPAARRNQGETAARGATRLRPEVDAFYPAKQLKPVAAHDHLGNVVQHMRDRRVARESSPHLANHRPRPVQNINVHRSHADQRTRAAVEAMLEVFGTPNDEEANVHIANMCAFIHGSPPFKGYGIPTSDPSDEERNGRALATLSSERRMDEEWHGITDPEQPYYIGQAATHSLPAKEVCAGLWRAIDSLDEDQRFPARTMFVSGLAECRQPDAINGQLSHVCRPGQFQQIATHLQCFFPTLIQIIPPIDSPYTHLKKFTDWIVETFPHASPEELTDEDRNEVHLQAAKVWGTYKSADRVLLEEGLLTRAEVSDRISDFDEGLRELLSFYELTWAHPHTPPRSPTPILQRTVREGFDEFNFFRGGFNFDDDEDMPDADLDNDNVVQPIFNAPAFLRERHVFAMPRPPQFVVNAVARLGAEVEDGGEEKPRHLLDRLIEQFEATHPTGHPDRETQQSFWNQAMHEGHLHFINRPEMGEFESYLRHHMLYEYNFRPPMA